MIEQSLKPNDQLMTKIQQNGIVCTLVGDTFVRASLIASHQL